ncbi:hypothetical protein [Lewinella sp. IMCC34183]|uniref:hypothetical protein n=1 Tax=Lewinella sp. IMCC34183 TaxID=2248762 RepID=UPI00130057DB|nr:hypothetical protein [Lewinella sp. IMCC34183]
MYRLPLFVVLLLLCDSAGAQSVHGRATDYDTISFAAFPPGFPRFETAFSDSIAARVAAGELRESLAYHHYLMIGRYGLVNAAAELPLEYGLATADTGAVRALADYRLVDAEAYIAEAARDKNLLIITEAHTKPQHRVFTRCLLDELYVAGYRHLGLENVLPAHAGTRSEPFDTLLQARGYPVQSAASGIYPSEPEYANLLRHALDLGFQLFAYERNGSSDSERDLQQAEHIVAYQQAHPGEKIVCHGGWSHAVETRTEKWPGSGSYWLAYHYRTLTGDDPLTVYQDAMNEKVAAEQSSGPYYMALLERLRPGDTPKVLVDSSGHSWKGPGGSLPFDIVTVEPPLNSRTGRGGWQDWSCDGRAYIDLDLGTLLAEQQPAPAYPVIVELRGRSESQIATPIYAAEIERAGTAPTIRLWNEPYRMVVKDRFGDRTERPVNE